MGKAPRTAGIQRPSFHLSFPFLVPFLVPTRSVGTRLLFLVPTLRVGTHPRTLCVPGHRLCGCGVTRCLDAERPQAGSHAERGNQEDQQEVAGTERRLLPLFLLPLLVFSAGCATGRERVDEALRADQGGPARNHGVAEHYTVRPPDVLEVTLRGQPGTCPVGLDGRAHVGPLGAVRVEGLTASEVARELAERAGLPAEAVRVRVADYRSQHVYLAGAGSGGPRAVPYQGPETVLDLLHRVGGIAPGAAPRDVHVLRAGVAEGRPPQVFHVDLRAAVLDHDQRTNLRLQPFDQIYVGETRESSLQKCFPRWLRPLYEAVCGLRREEDTETRRQGEREIEK